MSTNTESDTMTSDSELAAISAAKSAAVFSKFLDKSEYKMVVKINYRDIEELVEEFFGHNGYESVAEEEWRNDEVHEFDVEAEEASPYVQEKLDNAYNGKWDSCLYAYLNEMCRKGALPKCQMIVRVSW